MTPQEKLGHIDAGRGLAVLMVVWVHVFISYEGTLLMPNYLGHLGQSGVQFFFVLSAFTLCLSSEKRKRESQPVKKFFIRRFFRIAPAYYFGIIIYFFLDQHPLHHLEVPHGAASHYSFPNILSNVLFIHGFVPAANNTVVPGGWSIGTEMAFYLAFPLLNPLIKGFVGDSKIRAFNCCMVGVGFSFAACYWIHRLTGRYPVNNSFLYCNLLIQFPVFLLGMCYFHLFHSGAFRYSRGVCLAISMIGGSGMVFLWQYLEWRFKFVLFASCSGVTFIFLCHWLRGSRIARNKLLCSFGRVSYSIYLLHFLVIDLMMLPIKTRCCDIVGPNMAFAIQFLLTCFVSYGAALLSEKWIESPGIQLGRTLISKLKA